ncbi:MAG: P27 family phage terminase small subunit [Ruminococcus sp.]|nr:P27 family phage terminase small subunit [Ruminococcus sp.]MCM1380361.1 P27 family phage terminase small subunit [Muribaculaceae bacterium]MCM1478329.1 P27 family phage terminase small subunit [Muribaculaceae bacterium]
MARPSKPVSVIMSEGKSHRTKDELKARAEAESSVLSGAPLTERQEVRKNKIAHKEFLRVSKLMASIEKSDALYSSGINTYCMLYAEIRELQGDIAEISALAEQTREKFYGIADVTAEELAAFTRQINKLLSQKTALMSAIDRKRSMMLAIDKENVMTISAALRTIPKSPQKQTNPIADLLGEFDK